MKNLVYKRIAIVKLSAMGDIIHAMVALQFIKDKFPNLIIDWFVEKSFSQILKDNPNIDNIIEVDLKSIKKDKLQIFNQIKIIKKYSSNNYDLVIDTQGLLKSAIVSRLLGKNVVGFDKNSIREKIATFFYKYKVSVSYEENVILRNIKVLCSPFKIEPTLKEIENKKRFVFFKNNTNLDKYISLNKKNIIFVIGASWKSKMYPKEKFIKLANMINENILIIWGNELEKEIAFDISSKSKAIMIDKINLNDLKALISRVDLVIGNDTGPTHLAWASNVKSITLFGNTPGYRNTFVSNENRIVQSNKTIDPNKIDKNDYCINEIKEEDILKNMESLLNG